MHDANPLYSVPFFMQYISLRHMSQAGLAKFEHVIPPGQEQ